MKPTRRAVVIAAASALAIAITGTIIVVNTRDDGPVKAKPPAASSPTSTPSASPAPPYVAPTAEAIAALPEAMYSAVLPGLMPYSSDGVPKEMTAVYRIASDQPLFGEDRVTPVGRFAAKNFLAQDSVIAPVAFEGDWALVLTPSRSTLPSEDPDAPAQTVAWIPAASLVKLQDLAAHIVVSVGDETVSIVGSDGTVQQSFDAGVGAEDTPTPVGSVGYMQARYLDPAQGQEVYPIGLTSLHSDAADEPFGGSDGGLIGIHYQPNRDGAISHGCIRMSGEAITALDTLPLGTPVVMAA